MGEKTFNLTWNNHLANLSGLFEGLYKSGALTDTTLACQGGSLRAHRLVLAACSPFFERVFKEHYGDQPILILKSVSVEEMECLLDFMYRGSIDVAEEHLGSLIRTATDLEIRGLSGDCGNELRNPYIRTQKSNTDNRIHNVEYKKANSAFPPKQQCLDLLDSSVKMEEIEVEDDPMVMETHEANFDETIMTSEENNTASISLYNRETRYKGQKRVAVGRTIRNQEQTDRARAETSLAIDIKQELNFNGTMTDPTVPAIQMNEEDPDQDENVLRSSSKPTTSTHVGGFKNKISTEKCDEVKIISTNETPVIDLVDDHLSKRQKVSHDFNFTIFEGGLRECLKSRYEYKKVAAKTEELDETDRRLICQFVVNFLLENHSTNNRINPAFFMKAAQEIVADYPKESVFTWYVPYKPKRGNAPKVSASGKLACRYFNIKRNPRSGGETSRTSESGEIHVDFEENLIAFQYLKCNMEVSEKLIDYWDISFPLRHKFLTDYGIHRYFKEFPILSSQSGISLLVKDFDKLYPEYSDRLYETWDSFSQQIFKLCLIKRIIPADLIGCDKDALTIRYLPMLFPAVNVGSKKSEIARTNKAAIQESFFLHITDASDVEKVIQSKRKEAEESSTTVQPFILGIGDIQDRLSTFIVVDEVMYKTESCAQALDNCYKLFFALKERYPDKCKPVWMLIQSYLYGMKTQFDKVYTCVEVIKTELASIPV